MRYVLPWLLAGGLAYALWRSRETIRSTQATDPDEPAPDDGPIVEPPEGGPTPPIPNLWDDEPQGEPQQSQQAVWVPHTPQGEPKQSQQAVWVPHTPQPQTEPESEPARAHVDQEEPPETATVPISMRYGGGVSL